MTVSSVKRKAYSLLPSRLSPMPGRMLWALTHVRKARELGEAEERRHLLRAGWFEEMADSSQGVGNTER